MKNIKKLIMIVFLVDGLLIMIALSQGFTWLLNTQLAFLSSALVTLASYVSYKKVIEKRVAQEKEKIDDPDVLEKIDDPFDLYSEEVPKQERDLKEVIQQERAKVISLKTTAHNLSKTISGAFSPWRLLSYLFLFVAFLYLVNNHLFIVWAYVAGLFVTPLAALIYAIMIRERG